MEFAPNHAGQTPRNTYPCLATIGFGPAPTTRRLSFGGGGSGGAGGTGAGEEDTGLRRVISGGRRKSSFGAGEDGMGRRSIEQPPAQNGPWYWRVQAGVTDTHLVLLPLSQPPNPLLTSPPAPLSHAMPSHSSVHNPSAAQEASEGFADKLKNLFRRSSATPAHQQQPGAGAASASGNATALADQSAITGTQSTEGGAGSQGGEKGHLAGGAAGETIVDQNARGDQLPSGEANKIGATSVNANAELAWPGIIGGQRLGAVRVPLTSIKREVTLGGGKKNEGSWVTLVVNAAGGLEPVGANAHGPRAGHIKLEFDKDWIGAKGEAEVLHYQITNAIEQSAGAQPVDVHDPLAGQESFQIGQHGSAASAVPTAAAGAGPADDVAPDESVVSSRSGKVAG